MLANKNSTKFILLSILFIASLVFLSSDALAAKKGTITAKRCGGTLVANIYDSSVTQTWTLKGKNVLDRKIYSYGKRRASTIDRGAIYSYRLPKSIKTSNISLAFITSNKSYRVSLSSALKAGKKDKKYKLCRWA